jgi:hypothetical protein
MAKLIKPLFAVPDGEIHPRWFQAGEDVTGNVERAAKDQGKLAKTKAMRAPENKRG